VSALSVGGSYDVTQSDVGLWHPH